MFKSIDGETPHLQEVTYTAQEAINKFAIDFGHSLQPIAKSLGKLVESEIRGNPTRTELLFADMKLFHSIQYGMSLDRYISVRK